MFSSHPFAALEIHQTISILTVALFSKSTVLTTAVISTKFFAYNKSLSFQKPKVLCVFITIRVFVYAYLEFGVVFLFGNNYYMCVCLKGRATC